MATTGVVDLAAVEYGEKAERTDFSRSSGCLTSSPKYAVHEN